MIMVDTDVMVDLLQGKPPAIAWFAANRQQIVLSTLVVLELFNGCRDKRELNFVQSTLQHVKTAWLSKHHAEEARSVFEAIHLKNAIGIIDVLIGQTAIQEGLTLYTFNEKHYKMIPNIQLAQPYKR
jgi:hypothetical protein